jgi:predicted TIM-barrel fold metal-dependent hydrolase
MSRKAISDEEIIAALLQSATLKEAAALAGISPRSLYDRMNNEDFIAAYQRAKAEHLRAALLSLNGKVEEAIATTAEIMRDEKTNPATRLQAAQTILNHAGRISKQLSQEEAEAAKAARIAQNGLLFGGA